ncbi:MAG: TetR/AcrR family transcriptional regulator, partial [Solirubrobacteraceae bacterium]
MTVSPLAQEPDDPILVAALRALNADPTASMAQIAEAAGVGRATLHRHFASREVLLHEIGVHALDRWEASLRASGVVVATGGDDADVHRTALRAMVERYVGDTETFSFALTSPELEAHPDLKAHM